MKKKFFILLFSLFPIFVVGQENTIKWSYPVQPGTEKWEQLNSFSERLDAFNLPDSILKQISTKELVETCINYPYWILITNRNSNQEGYDYLKTKFNGFGELEKRKDAGKEILTVYLTIHPEKKKNYKTLIERGNFSFKILFIELLISQPNVLRHLDYNDFKILLQKANSIFEVKLNPENNYSGYMLSSTGLVIARTLKFTNYVDLIKNNTELSGYEDFINNGSYIDRKGLEHIYIVSKIFTKTFER